MADQPNSHIKELLVNYFNCLERFNFSKAGELLRIKGVSLRLDLNKIIQFFFFSIMTRFKYRFIIMKHANTIFTIFNNYF